MQYVVKEQENIYDVALRLYGSARYAVRLLVDNPEIENLDNVSIANISLAYDATIKTAIKSPLIVSNSVINDKKNDYIIKTGQSIYDLAIMYGYGISGIIEFLQDNIELENLDNTEIQNQHILVTKRATDLTDALILQNKTLSTNIIKDPLAASAQGLQTDSEVDLQTDDGDYLTVD